MTNPFEVIEARLSTIETLLIDIKHFKEEQSTFNTRQIFNLDQFCEYTSLSKQTVYKKTSKGEIPHSKRGKRLFFEKASVDEWLLENRVGNKSEIEAKANNYLTTRRRARTRL